MSIEKRIEGRVPLEKKKEGGPPPEVIERIKRDVGELKDDEKWEKNRKKRRGEMKEF